MKFIKGDPESYEGVYPVGENISTWKNYCEDVAKVIVESLYSYNNNLPPKEQIALVCRGTSGNILAGIVSYLIETNYDYECNVIPIRKGRAHSSLTGEGPTLNCCDAIIVIDDFIATGKTILEILNALNDYFLTNYPEKSEEQFHMLCVGNKWSKRCFSRLKPEVVNIIHRKFKNILFYAGH